MNAITFFSGGGGADIGLSLAGLTVVAAFERDPRIAPYSQATCMDVLQLLPCDLPRADFYHFSPPCQSFSVAGSKNEQASDMDLARKIVEILQWNAPQFVTIENVMQYRASSAFRFIVAEVLDRLGYFWTAEILNASDYGVPQQRKRLIVRASRNSMIKQIEMQPKRGWGACLDGLDLTPAKPSAWLADKISRLVGDSICYNANNWMSFPNSHEPAPTLTVTCATHPILVRLDDKWYRVPMRFAARLQSFPDSYQLPDRVGLAGTIIGNAVPPLLMKQVARSLA